MSIKYYISPIIGDGTEGNSFRPKLSNYKVNWVAEIKSGLDGKPAEDWSLVCVNCDEKTHSIITEDKDIKVISMDNKEDICIFSSKKNITQINTLSTTEDIINCFGTKLNSNYSKEKMFIGE
jgi:hypothetical protein